MARGVACCATSGRCDGSVESPRQIKHCIYNRASISKSCGSLAKIFSFGSSSPARRQPPPSPPPPPLSALADPLSFVDPRIGTGGEGFGVGSVPISAQVPFIYIYIYKHILIIHAMGCARRIAWRDGRGGGENKRNMLAIQYWKRLVKRNLWHTLFA